MNDHLYRIVLNNELKPSDRAWLADLAVEPSQDYGTALSARLDQSGLFGVLARCQFLGLELCQVLRMCGCLTRRHRCAADLGRDEPRLSGSEPPPSESAPGFTGA
jgi:hypothetical protein